MALGGSQGCVVSDWTSGRMALIARGSCGNMSKRCPGLALLSGPDVETWGEYQEQPCCSPSRSVALRRSQPPTV
jgi:hypothetical protein